MTRELDTATLEGAARYYATEWARGPGRRSERNDSIADQLAKTLTHPALTDPERVEIQARVDALRAATPRWIRGRELVLQDMYNFDFKDEFEFIREAMMDKFLAPADRKDFETATKDVFKPREDEVFHELLKQKLALSPAGDHIDGEVGTTNVGYRKVGLRVFQAEALHSIRRRKLMGLPIHLDSRPDREIVEHVRHEKWPIYIGEGIERAEGRIKSAVGAKEPGADPLPEGAIPLSVGAAVANFSAEVCILALDAVADNLDEGSTAAEIRGRTGAQPADPDAAETGTLLFTCAMSATAFGAAADDADGTCSVAAATITDDTSADATNTLTYCRMAATGTGADDHIDGNAGTTDECYIFNTVSIVSGSTVSITSCTVGLSQGSTAT